MITAGLLLASATLSDEGWGGRHASNRELQNEKRGRVIDATSGSGVPDAKVIAIWRGSSFGVGGSSSGCVLQRIATTDANGNFVIPNVAHELNVKDRGSPGVTPFAGVVVDYTWNLIVFKPGYVREDDTHLFGKPDPERLAFAWDHMLPNVSNEWSTVNVKDIQMRRAEFNFQDTIHYYGTIRQATSCSKEGIEQREIRDIREEISKLVRPLPCSLPSESPVNAQVAMIFSPLLGDARFFENMKSEGQKAWPWTQTTAGAMCRALGGGSKTP